MTLVLRKEIQLQCRSVGHNIVDAVLDKGTPLSDTQLDDMFNPLVNKVQSVTEQAINASLDELRGELEERQAMKDLDDIICQRKSDITESLILHVICQDRPDYRKKIKCYNDIRRSTANINVFRYEPEKDYRELDEDSFLIHIHDDETAYMRYTRVYIHDVHLYDLLMLSLEHRIQTVYSYVSREHISLEKLIEYIEELQATGVTLDPDYRAILRLKDLDLGSGLKCQRVIKRGIRKGRLCERPVKKRHVCKYHLYCV